MLRELRDIIYNVSKQVEINIDQMSSSSLISDKEFNRIKGLRRFEIGKTQLFGKDFYFSDNLGFLHSITEIFEEQVYKFHSTNNKPFIIDAGSNIGLSIIYFKQLYPKSKIIGFEPDPQIFDLLQKNISSFNLSEIEIRNSAVWIKDTELEFYSEGSLAGSTEVDFNRNNNKCLVKAEELRKFIPISKVDFLKIDIEGAENIVLLDLKDELKYVENLFLEYHSIYNKEQRLGDILNLIKDSGFRYYIKLASDVVKFPFNDHPTSEFDLQLNIFCFRM